MSEGSERRFTREFKLAALARMAAGENVSALAREFGIARKYLYQWRERFRIGGAVALRSRGRPTKAEARAIRLVAPAPAAHAASSASSVTAGAPAATGALAAAERRIAELERKVGQQELELDFFQRALRHIEEARLRNGALGGTPTMRSSKR